MVLFHFRGGVKRAHMAQQLSFREQKKPVKQIFIYNENSDETALKWRNEMGNETNLFIKPVNNTFNN